MVWGTIRSQLELFEGRFEILKVLLLVWLLGEDFRFESPNWKSVRPRGFSKAFNRVGGGGANQSMGEDPNVAVVHDISLFVCSAGFISKELSDFMRLRFQIARGTIRSHLELFD